MALVRNGSLRIKLPATIAATLLVGVLAFGALAYAATRMAILQSAERRLAGTATSLAAPTPGGNAATAARERRFADAAADAAVRAILASRRATPDAATRTVSLPGGRAAEAAAMAVLAKLGPDTGSIVGTELRDTSGATLLTATGRPGRGVRHATTGRDTAKVSSLFTSGDSVLLEYGTPVMDGDKVIGRISQSRLATTGNSAAIKRASDLFGDEVQFLVGNADGSVWTDLQKRIVRPPPSMLEPYERDGRLRVSSVAKASNSPLMIAVEAPVDRLTAPAQNLVGVFLLIGLIVIGAGTVIGWRMTSGIATSMVQLTEAAEAIAHNRADAAIPVDRADEVGRLGRAFAVMRDAVKTSRDTLESQVLSRTQELRVAQSELVKRERLATLGQLSSSVGHELRNPLGVMTNAVYFLEMTLTDVPKKAKDYLGIIRSQVRISEKIVSDLLDFARVKPPQRARVAVTQLVDDQLGRVTVPDTVRIDRDGIDSAGSVWVDQVQIGQVILNVVTNALQAMEEKGGVLAVTSKVEAGMVRLEVTDSGPGITPENMERIFEPLFTTKARGIGLGLSVSRSLAESNGGQLTVTSAAGKGATFSLTMPTGEG